MKKRTRELLFGAVAMWGIGCAAGWSQEATRNEPVFELGQFPIEEPFGMYFSGPDMLMTPERLFWYDKSPKRRKLVICGYETKSLQGRLEIRKGLGFVYHPAKEFAKLKPGEHAIDTFKYKVFDGDNFDWRTARIEVRGKDPRVNAAAGRWETKLAAKARRLIAQEIDLLEKRAEEKLTDDELAHVERSLDASFRSLRKWFGDEGSGFVVPKFVGFLKPRDAGTDLIDPPYFTEVKPTISSSVSGKGDLYYQKAFFQWTSSGGQFVNEWTEQTPVDEEYRVAVTGKLFMEIKIEQTVAGKVIRVHETTDKPLIDRQSVVLKGSTALHEPPLNR